jgi:hypothetical protein
MNKSDIEATEHVAAIVCLPIRRPAEAEPDKPVSPKVRAVLALDAIMEEGAVGLQECYDRFGSQKHPDFLALVECLGIYFQEADPGESRGTNRHPKKAI